MVYLYLVSAQEFNQTDEGVKNKVIIEQKKSVDNREVVLPIGMG